MGGVEQRIARPARQIGLSKPATTIRLIHQRPPHAPSAGGGGGHQSGSVFSKPSRPCGRGLDPSIGMYRITSDTQCYCDRCSFGVRPCSEARSFTEAEIFWRRSLHGPPGVTHSFFIDRERFLRCRSLICRRGRSVSDAASAWEVMCPVKPGCPKGPSFIIGGLLLFTGFSPVAYPRQLEFRPSVSCCCHLPASPVESRWPRPHPIAAG